jgi:predicted AAA+ superfamily ATPase
MTYHARLLEQKLLKLSKVSPVIVLTGARQVGKSTILKHLFPHARNIVFDPVVDVGNARQDPEFFLDQLPLPVILDEIQYAPELLPIIKRRADEQQVPGSYLITGSQNLSMLKNVSESLAGRAILFTLYPMTLGERYGNAVHWVNDYINNPQTFLTRQFIPNNEETLISMIWKGGYPGLLSYDEENYADMLGSYFSTYIERDLRLLSEVSDLQDFSRFVQLIANLTAQEINYNELGREISISPKTAHRWLNILKSTYQWVDLPAYSGNTIKRISNKSKGYFIDTGMACFLSHISTAEALLGHPKLGALFETYVVNDILRQLPLLPGKPAIYHWRSHAGAEVDLLIEINNIYYPIEIKCKTRPSRIDTSGIRAFRETYPKLTIAPGLIICPVKEVTPLGNGCYAIPFNY